MSAGKAFVVRDKISGLFHRGGGSTTPDMGGAKLYRKRNHASAGAQQWYRNRTSYDRTRPAGQTSYFRKPIDLEIVEVDLTESGTTYSIAPNSGAKYDPSMDPDVKAAEEKREEDLHVPEGDLTIRKGITNDQTHT